MKAYGPQQNIDIPIGGINLYNECINLLNEHIHCYSLIMKNFIFITEMDIVETNLSQTMNE